MNISKGLSKQRQQGVAVIMFILMIPVLLGMLALGVDGANFLRAHARANDAIEVASLVLSARGLEDEQLSEEDISNEELAELLVKTQIPALEPSQISLTPTFSNCETNCGQGVGGEGSKLRYAQFLLTGTVQYPSLFPHMKEDGGLGFSETITFGGQATSRKYLGRAVDLVFVVDFSGSMTKEWIEDGNRQDTIFTKIAGLKLVVSEVAELVKKNTATNGQKNTMALVPFNFNTVEKGKKDDGSDCAITQLIYESKYAKKGEKERHTHADYVDYEKTMAALLDEKGCSNDTRRGRFYTIGLTTEADDITIPLNGREADPDKELDKVYPMTAQHGTATFEGIIRGAQLLYKHPEPNDRQLLVVLSDGMDSDTYAGKLKGKKTYYAKKKIHENLLHLENNKGTKNTSYTDNNYCSYLKAELEKQDSRNGIKVEATLAVIGFDYDVDDNQNLKDCVGEENVYSAASMGAVKSKLLELIGEEVGRLYTDTSQYQD